MTIDAEHPDGVPVVVIGGGLAGLTAAVHLAERGITPVVLEADQLWAGGRLSGGAPETFTHDGREWSFPSEHGIHALWGGYVNMRATLDRFVGVELVPSTGEVWINRWRQSVRRVEAGSAVRTGWLPAPFHYLQLLFNPVFWTTITPLDFLSLPGFLVSVLLTVGFDPIKEGRALDGLLMKEYFRGWTPNLKASFVGLGKNLLAAPADQITLTGFIAALRFYTMLNRSAWHPHFFPDDADTALIAPLTAKLQQLGGQIIYGATAERLTRTEAGWTITVYAAAKHGLRSITAARVIVATNAPAAARLFAASPATAETAAQLRFPGGLRTTTVRLWFSRAPDTPGVSGMLTGDFAFDNFFWLDCMQPAFIAWREATGGSAVELHLYGTDAQTDEPENLLIIRAVNEIQRAYPELKGSFIHGAVRRNSRTHTAFRVPTADSLHVHTPFDGILACGDWIGWDTPSLWMERACTTGIAAANAVISAHGGEPYPLYQPTPERFARALGAVMGVVRRAIIRPIAVLSRALKRRGG